MEKGTVAKALEMALESGAAQARATLTEDIENSVVALNGEVDRLFGSSGEVLSIQIYTEGRYGSYSTNCLQDDDLRKFIDGAVRTTRLLEADPCHGLPDKELYFTGEPVDLDKRDPLIGHITQRQRMETAVAACREAMGVDDRMLSIETEYGDMDEHTLMADTQGFIGETTLSHFTISAQCSVRGRGDEKPESYWFDSALKRSDLKAEGCGATALSRAIESLDKRKVRSGRYNMVIEPQVASKVLSPIISALNGANLQQGNSFLVGKKGAKVFGDGLTLVDRPLTRGAYGARCFDIDGIATRERYIIRNGVVGDGFITSYYARKMGVPVTVDGPSVLMFEKESVCQKKSLTLEDIMKSADKGILVTDFNGGNCNQVTGDFSYGIQGFLFEKGEKVHPIGEMNITGNIISLWNGIIAIGDDPWKALRWQMPTLAFEGVDFNGI